MDARRLSRFRVVLNNDGAPRDTKIFYRRNDGVEEPVTCLGFQVNADPAKPFVELVLTVPVVVDVEPEKKP